MQCAPHSTEFSTRVETWYDVNIEQEEQKHMRLIFNGTDDGLFLHALDVVSSMAMR